MARSGDEPFTLYGLIAESVEVPEDRSCHHLPSAPARRAFPTARRSRRRMSSSAMRSLKEKGWPYHRSHYGKVTRGRENRPPQRALHVRGRRRPRDPPDPRADADPAARTSSTPRPSSDDAGAAARQRPLHASRASTSGAPSPTAAIPTGGRATFPSRAAASTSTRSASNTSATPPRCSRPSRPARSTCGRRTIRAAGSRATAFPRSTDGRVVKREFDTRPAVRHVGAGVQYAPARLPAMTAVRRAFILLFDAEWINRSLFNGLYQRTQSFFERSELSSHRPAGRRARARAAGALRTIREAGRAGRHATASRATTAAAITAPTCRPPSSF